MTHSALLIVSGKFFKFPKDKTDWPRQHEWLAKRVNEMLRVFAPRVRALEAAD